MRRQPFFFFFFNSITSKTIKFWSSLVHGTHWTRPSPGHEAWGTVGVGLSKADNWIFFCKNWVVGSSDACKRCILFFCFFLFLLSGSFTPIFQTDRWSDGLIDSCFLFSSSSAQRSTPFLMFPFKSFIIFSSTTLLILSSSHLLLFFFSASLLLLNITSFFHCLLFSSVQKGPQIPKITRWFLFILWDRSSLRRSDQFYQWCEMKRCPDMMMDCLLLRGRLWSCLHWVERWVQGSGLGVPIRQRNEVLPRFYIRLYQLNA